ncbi:unnamed protein product [Caenorhabditis brenneri]
MTIGLLHFPILVQEAIVQNMRLLEAFILSTLSKKTFRTVSLSFRRQNFDLMYNVKGLFRLEKVPYLNEDSEFKIELIEYQKKEDIYKRPDPNVLPVQVLEKLVGVFSPKEITEFIISLLRNVRLMLAIKSTNVETFRNVLEIFKPIKEIDEIEILRPIDSKHDDDELTRLVLEEARCAKVLRTDLKTTSNFTYDYTKNEPFSFDVISWFAGRWITKNHILTLFMNCKAVSLPEIDYEDAEIAEILQKWKEGSKLEWFRISRCKLRKPDLLTNLVKHFPGATPIRKAQVNIYDQRDLLVIDFRDDTCFMVQRHDGTEFLVYFIGSLAGFTKDFKIGEDIDGMETDPENDYLNEDADYDESEDEEDD